MTQVDQVRAVLAAQLRRKMSDKPRLVFAAMANYEFEGELKKAGDQVSVPIEPKITLTDVSERNSGDLRATSLEDIDASDRVIAKDTLVVNKYHRFREKISTLEEVQTLYNIKDARRSSLLTAIDNEVEKGVLQVMDTMFADSDNAWQVISGTIDRLSVSDAILEAKAKLEEAEVWDDCVLVVSPKMASIIATAKILNNTERGANAAIQGYVGEYGGFQIYKSNFISNKAHMYAFKPRSYNYVRQLAEIDLTKAPAGFYYNLMWQLIHGGKVFDQNVEQLVKIAGTFATNLNPDDKIFITNTTDNPVPTQAVV